MVHSHHLVNTAIKKSKLEHYLRTWRYFHKVLICKESKIHVRKGKLGLYYSYRVAFPQ